MKRAKRRKQKSLGKARSPYAKSLENRQYRHRILESKRLDTDDWIEDALEEYYSNAQDMGKEKDSEENKTSYRSGEPGADESRNTNETLVGIHQEQEERKGTTETK